MNGIRAPRVIRYVLVACACLGVIFLFLLATASANTALFARSYNLLLVLNFTMVAVLMGLVGYQLLRLRKQHKAGVFGQNGTLQAPGIFLRLLSRIIGKRRAGFLNISRLGKRTK